MRSLMIMTVALGIGLAAGVAGADQMFDNDGGDGLWSNPLNWQSDATLPDGERAILVNGLTATVDSAIAEQPTEVRVGENGTAGGVAIAPGGSLTTTNHFIVGRNGEGEHGTLTMTGGDLNIGGNFWISQVGQAGGLTGEVYQSGGTITAPFLETAPFNNEGVNTALYEISGDAVLDVAGAMQFVSAEDDSGSGDVGQSVSTTFRILGSMVTLDVESFAFAEAGPTGGTTEMEFDFVFDAAGITTFNSSGDISLAAPTEWNDPDHTWDTLLSIDLAALSIASDQTYTLFQADSDGLDGSAVSGAFASEDIDWTGNANITGATVRYESDAVYLDVTAIPEPATLALLAAGGLAVLRWRE